jgi:hypothetical protein
MISDIHYTPHLTHAILAKAGVSQLDWRTVFFCQPESSSRLFERLLHKFRILRHASRFPFKDTSGRGFERGALVSDRLCFDPHGSR